MLRRECHAVEVAPFGSYPFGTYLPEGDIDICALFNPDIAAKPGETGPQRYARTNGDAAAYWLLEVEKVLWKYQEERRGVGQGGHKVPLQIRRSGNFGIPGGLTQQ